MCCTRAAKRFSRALTVGPPPGPAITIIPLRSVQSALYLHMVAQAVTHGAHSLRCVPLCVMNVCFPLGYKSCVRLPHTQTVSYSFTLCVNLASYFSPRVFLCQLLLSVIAHLSVYILSLLFSSVSESLPLFLFASVSLSPFSLSLCIL